MAEVFMETRDLCKNIGGNAVLADVNLDIKKGEVFAILGPSGAGKTTLLRILNTLEAPTSGRVVFDGKDPASLGKEDLLHLRRRMVLLIQGSPLFNTTVFENVAYPLRVRGHGKREIEEMVAEALGHVGLGGYEDRRAATLSGGERQRVTFAMATVFGPEVLLLDEPTANLDPINVEMVEGFILGMKERGVTVIISTHKQAEAIGLADRIGVIREGRIEQIGPPAEIFYSPRTTFVARFTGTKNIFDARVVSSDRQAGRTIVDIDGIELEADYCEIRAGPAVNVCIRPEEIMVLREDRPIRPIHVNIIEGTIVRKNPFGGSMERLHVDTPLGEVAVDSPRHVVEVMGLGRGRAVRLSLKKRSCRIVER